MELVAGVTQCGNHWFSSFSSDGLVSLTTWKNPEKMTNFLHFHFPQRLTQCRQKLNQHISSYSVLCRGPCFFYYLFLINSRFLKLQRDVLPVSTKKITFKKKDFHITRKKLISIGSFLIAKYDMPIKSQIHILELRPFCLIKYRKWACIFHTF